MSKFNNRARKWKGRQTFNVPASVGGYANEVLAFGFPLGVPQGSLNPANAGVSDESYEEVMALIESIVAGATVELWVRKNSDDTEAVATMDLSDYFLFPTPSVGTPTVVGVLRWVLSGWPAGIIRVKSAGTGGAMVISATAL